MSVCKLSRTIHAASAAGQCRSLNSSSLGSLTHRRPLRFKLGANPSGASRCSASVSEAQVASKPLETDTTLKTKADPVLQGSVQKRSRSSKPMLMADFIKCQWLAASRNVASADPYTAMSIYMMRMDELCYTNQKLLDYMHICAILHGTARINLSAGAVHVHWLPPEGVKHLRAFLSRMLAMLQQVMPDVRSRQASSTFWAFAKLRINPDHLLPGTVDGLAQQFVADMSSATGQSYASVLVSCVELGLDPCRGRTLQTVLQRLSSTDASKFNCQELANITHCLAKLPTVQPSAQLLDVLCDGLLYKLQSNDPRQQLDSQAISSFAWSLQKLKHEPSQAVAAGMLSGMLDLCRAPTKQRPSSQSISNLLLASAVLRFAMTQHQADALVINLLDQEKVETQDLANTAWSLAVSGFLHINAFGHLLHRLLTLSTKQGPLLELQIAQLHQANDWLSPQKGASLQYQQAWTDLQPQLQLLGPRPEPDKEPLAVSNLPAALAALGLCYQATLQIKGYTPGAVVPAEGSTAKPILFMVETDCFSNNPARLTGRTVFCRRLLFREGLMISIPLEVASGSVEQLVDFLQPRLETVTRGTLDMYRI